MVPKLILLFTMEGWSAQPFSINFGDVDTYFMHFAGGYTRTGLSIFSQNNTTRSVLCVYQTSTGSAHIKLALNVNVTSVVRNSFTIK